MATLCLGRSRVAGAPAHFGRSDPKLPSALLLEALETSSALSCCVEQHSRGALAVIALTAIELLEDQRLKCPPCAYGSSRSSATSGR